MPTKGPLQTQTNDNSATIQDKLKNISLIVHSRVSIFNTSESVRYLKGFHHELRIDKENTADVEFPLLQLLHKLFHHRQVSVEFNLT